MSLVNYSKNRNRKYDTGEPGQPPKYGTPKSLQVEVDAYFQEVEQCGEAPLITGLALYLGFSNRSSLRDYEKRGNEYSRIIKRAIGYIEAHREGALLGFNPSGSIFWLKNHGWDAEQNTNSNVTLGYSIDIGEPPAISNEEPEPDEQ